ncbi:MAG: PAS domain-containing sensor histidine kinase, partial [Thermodesulfobacteriota bacterium]
REVLGRPAKQIIGEDIIDGEHLILTDKKSIETSYTHKDGSKIPVLFSSSTLMDSAKEKLTGAVYLALDITERKASEELLQKSNQQLQKLADELKQANEEMKSFTYIVSHDLRAPLVNIKGFSSELRMSLDDLTNSIQTTEDKITADNKKNINLILNEDVPEALNFIESSVSRMDALINGILKLSRLGRYELKTEDVDLSKTISSILDSIKHQLESKKVKVSIGPLPTLKADETVMEQIFGNLIDNATKYLADDRDGELTFKAEEKGEEITISCRDNGRGIADEDIDKIFKIFRRAGKQDIKGEGMGLAYVKTLVKRLDGNISCQSKLNIGTTFTIGFPKDLLVESKKILLNE